MVMMIIRLSLVRTIVAMLTMKKMAIKKKNNPLSNHPFVKVPKKKVAGGLEEEKYMREEIYQAAEESQHYHPRK